MQKELKVLLLTSKSIFPHNTRVLGDTPLSAFGDSELEDYVELLSLSNIAFDIKYSDEFSFEDIVCDNVIHYSTLVIALPAGELSASNCNVIKKISGEFGVSVIASFDRINESMISLFGIKRIICRKYRFPCAITINEKIVAGLIVEPEIKLGIGFKLNLLKGGFRRNPLEYFKKQIRAVWTQVWTYSKIETVSEAEHIAVIKGTQDPAIVKYKYGKATNYYIALESDSFLDEFNSLHKIIKEIIISNSGWGMSSIDLENTMILRMDDPGTSERVYLKGYDAVLMSKKEWQEITGLLRKYQAGLSVMYVPLWVDDGNTDNGRLFIKNKEIENRLPGGVYKSREVCFIKKDNSDDTKKYDYISEFEALQDAVLSGLVDIESHGLTHIDPDLNLWLKANDRYTNRKWYSEFKHLKSNKDCTEAEQSRIAIESARLIEELFAISPTAITPSGHNQSSNSEEMAHKSGYRIFSGDYNSFEVNGLIMRNDKFQSVFLDKTVSNDSFSKAGYPVVGVFHDYDIVKGGAKWLEKVIKDWKNKGIEKLITLGEAAGYLCSSIKTNSSENEIVVEIDISKTTGVSEKLKSSYFSRNQMMIDVRLPQGKTVKDIFIEGHACKDFEYKSQEKSIKIRLASFEARQTQSILIKLQ